MTFSMCERWHPRRGPDRALSSAADLAYSLPRYLSGAPRYHNRRPARL